MLLRRREFVTLSIFALAFISVLNVNHVRSQEPAFELPVQLIGFPVIIMAVRMSNFVRKLAYSLNPSTYRRNARSADGVAKGINETSIDFGKAEKDLVAQLGPGLCVYEDVCLQHVKTAGQKTGSDWYKILRQYTSIPAKKGQFYLLSVFLGDLIGSYDLCKHFTRVGRSCN